MTVKAIAINSSPNMDKGNTALILDPFEKRQLSTSGDKIRTPLKRHSGTIIVVTGK